jgi:hypothetical protein
MKYLLLSLVSVSIVGCTEKSQAPDAPMDCSANLPDGVGFLYNSHLNLYGMYSTKTDWTDTAFLVDYLHLDKPDLFPDKLMIIMKTDTCELKSLYNKVIRAKKDWEIKEKEAQRQSDSIKMEIENLKPINSPDTTKPVLVGYALQIAKYYNLHYIDTGKSTLDTATIITQVWTKLKKKSKVKRITGWIGQ